MLFDRKTVDRVVVDTNIFVSGTAIATGNPVKILSLWRDGAFVLVTSPKLLAEATDVLTRPKIMTFTGLTLHETQQFLQEIADRSVVTKGEYHVEPLVSNPPDTFVLQAAIEGQATHIVTGDKTHLLPLRKFRGIPIVTPQDYLSRFYK
jgi:putative PIN family toxin of toxin-antitoxin system